ncbi:MAG: AMP-binding protein [Desulfosalsimonadaceae bacterium]
MGLRDYTVYDFIRRNADLYPQRDCMVFAGSRTTHREFKQKCDQMAAGLLQQGVRQGDRVGVLARNCGDYLVLYGAAARIGAIVLPVNWRFQSEEVAYVLNDGAPSVVFAGPEFQQTLVDIRPELEFDAAFFAIGGDPALEGFSAFDSLCRSEEGLPEFAVDGNSGFVIIHTAAVEAKPRGALLSQSNIVSINLQIMLDHCLGPESGHMCILPLFHIAGLAHAMANMHAGGKNVIMERFDPEKTLKLIEAEKGTTFYNFSPILKRLIETCDELGGKVDLSSLHHIDGMDHRENLERFREIAPNVQFSSGFGQTEAMQVSWSRWEERPGSAGKPTTVSRVALFDEDDKPVPIGETGEICVRGPTVFLGYWKREADTAYTFRSDWHHTGDMARFDEDGYLWYVKRKAEKELIKPGGENVYPAEVEKVIREHPAVSEVSVIGVSDRQWGEAIKAVCVLQPGEKLDEQELIDFVAGKIARFKKPRFVVFVDSLPKTGDGSIDRDTVKKEHGGKY